jgi:hypothetical protein
MDLDVFVTRHTSHVTRHTSHVTRHTSRGRYTAASHITVEGPVLSLGDVVFRIGRHSISSSSSGGGGGSSSSSSTVSVEVTLLPAPPSIVIPATAALSSSSAAAGHAAVPALVANALALAFGSKWRTQCILETPPHGEL